MKETNGRKDERKRQWSAALVKECLFLSFSFVFHSPRTILAVSRGKDQPFLTVFSLPFHRAVSLWTSGRKRRQERVGLSDLGSGRTRDQGP